MNERLDIVLFGATGFTGKCTLPYVYKFCKLQERSLTWGVAGRSEQKLKAILSETAERIGVDDVNHIPIVTADVGDEESIRRMTSQAKVIINCCGPYEFYGEVVVKACVETGTHYVDVSGESLFIERMQLKYHKAAEEKGVYIVSACGFDSVPADLGTLFLEKHFEGTLNSVEIYIRRYKQEDCPPGPTGHYGTWESAINAIHGFWALLSLRKKLFPKALPAVRPKLSSRFPLHKKGDKWALPFPGTDYDVVNRSQRYFYEKEGKRPIQVRCYSLMGTFPFTIMAAILGFFVLLLAQCRCGKNLLLKYPECFSNGVFTKNDIPEEILQRFHFSFTLYGKGWKDKVTEFECKTPINKSMVARVSAVNPGYGFTCVALTLCAIMILNERSKLPLQGGVYTPAVAFSKTSLVEELQKNGTTVEILSGEEN